MVLNFKDDVAKSKTEEKRLRRISILSQIFRPVNYDDITFNRATPNDITITTANGSKIRIECKDQNAESYNIFGETRPAYFYVCIEKHNNANPSFGPITSGWTDGIAQKADYILVIWNAYCSVEGKYTNPYTYLLIDAVKLQHLWHQTINKYPEILNDITENNGKQWQSSFVYYPVKALIDEGVVKSRMLSQPSMKYNLKFFFDAYDLFYSKQKAVIESANAI